MLRCQNIHGQPASRWKRSTYLHNFKYYVGASSFCFSMSNLFSRELIWLPLVPDIMADIAHNSSRELDPYHGLNRGFILQPYHQSLRRGHSDFIPRAQSWVHPTYNHTIKIYVAGTRTLLRTLNDIFTPLTYYCLVSLTSILGTQSHLQYLPKKKKPY